MTDSEKIDLLLNQQKQTISYFAHLNKKIDNLSREINMKYDKLEQNMEFRFDKLDQDIETVVEVLRGHELMPR